jgi:hypothetical protein
VRSHITEDGCFRVHFTWVDQGGKPVLNGLTISPLLALPRGGLTATHVREIVRLTEALQDTRDSVDEVGGQTADAASFLQESPKFGRPPLRHELDHALLAWAFVVMLQGTPHPIAELAQLLAEKTDRIEGWVDAARREKFLTSSGTKGKAGGSLTQEAIDLLTAAGYDVASDDPVAEIQLRAQGTVEPVRRTSGSAESPES